MGILHWYGTAGALSRRNVLLHLCATNSQYKHAYTYRHTQIHFTVFYGLIILAYFCAFPPCASGGTVKGPAAVSGDFARGGAHPEDGFRSCRLLIIGHSHLNTERVIRFQPKPQNCGSPRKPAEGGRVLISLFFTRCRLTWAMWGKKPGPAPFPASRRRSSDAAAVPSCCTLITGGNGSLRFSPVRIRPSN